MSWLNARRCRLLKRPFCIRPNSGMCFRLGPQLLDGGLEVSERCLIALMYGLANLTFGQGKSWSGNLQKVLKHGLGAIYQLGGLDQLIHKPTTER